MLWLQHVLCFCFFLTAFAAAAFQPNPVPLVLPLATKSQLAVSQEGLDILSSLSGPVAPVVVIGPYRTGKSFLLNQLLGVSCEQGFGVGHTRNTQTKGIWLYGEPRDKALPNGESLAVLYFDTEGFESTGKSNSYDDRIFALAAILSSVLIYNLPETIRESDITKLSFAVELAQGFYDRYEDGTAGSFEPGAMLWLIQHDFLQGVTADEMVRQALAPVPNPSHDAEVDSLNIIRTSLMTLAGNSTGYSLRQPHLERTRLCELGDAELDPTYVQQRDALRGVVTGLARPKVVGGRQMTGKKLAELLVKMVELLNSQDIPNVGSMIEVFNKQVADKVTQQFVAKLSEIAVPMAEAVLDKIGVTLRGEALLSYEKQMLGRRRGVKMQTTLAQALLREFDIRKMENGAASDRLCVELENACEKKLDALQSMQLPSMRKFEASFHQCEEAFQERCLGPAKDTNDVRLQRSWLQAQALFAKEYNNRLYSGLLVICIAMVVIFRFIVKLQLGEAVGWLGFVALEVAPHVYPGPQGMYGSAAWLGTVQVWEVLMLLLFGFDGSWVLWLLAAIAFLVLRIRSRRAGLQAGGRKQGSASSRSPRDHAV